MKKNDRNIKAISFYLPQYHIIPENEEWWGTGFTEWTNVKKAKPNYEGHYQPHVPLNKKYYNLEDISVMKEQAQLAQKYGIYGFCFYWYWFNGTQVLEKPVDQYLNSDINFPFCLCWANENWTRTWDGEEKKILLKQEYNNDNLEEDFFERALPFFLDQRYIRINESPLLLIYRADRIPNLESIVKVWKRKAQEYGLPGITVAAVLSFDISQFDKLGCDIGVEFPPHQFFNYNSIVPRETLPAISKNFKGQIYDFAHGVHNSLLRTITDYRNNRIIPGFMPSWDNTARRQDTGSIFINSSPALFNYWIATKLHRLKSVNKTEQYLFVNAWNEWGEGCHLEPDEMNGEQFLIAFKSALDGNILEKANFDQNMKSISRLISKQTLKEKTYRFIKMFCLGNKTLERYLYKIGKIISRLFF